MAKDVRGTFVKLYRSAADNALFKEKPFDRWHAFEYLIMRAQVKPETVILKGQRVKLERGQLIESTDSMATKFGWSRGKVNRFLKLLKDEGMIDFFGTPNGTAITIEKYSYFQDVRTADGTTDGTPDGTTDGTQSKNDKNDKNERERGALPLVAFGRKKNVYLTADEKEKIKTTFESHQKLINKIGDIIANSNRDYPDHDALLWKIAEEDGWPKKTNRQPSRSGELTEAEKEAIRKQEEEWRNS
mgnify:CR=1 FL=1